MGTIPSAVHSWFWHILDAAVGPARTLADLDLPPGADAPIDWDDFTRLCRLLEEQFPSRKALLAATRRCARKRFAAQAANLPGGFTDQRQLYWLVDGCLRPRLLTDFGGSHRQLDDGRLRLEIAGPPGAETPAVLFEIFQILLMQAPLLVGQSATRVDAELAPNHATYVIVPSAHAESDLRERETLYRRLTEHASDIIAEIDDDGIITYASPNTLEILGRESSELLGQSAFDLLHAEDGGNDHRPIHERLHERRGAPYFRVRHRDGSWRWFDTTARRVQWDGSADRYILVARDVTDQRAAEIRTEDWRDRYEAIIRASGQMVYDWDLRTGAVELHGDERPFGLPVERPSRGRTDYLRELTPEDRRRFMAEFERASSAKDHFHIEFPLRLPGGEEIVVENHGYFLLDDDGVIRRMVGFANDVTERRRGERALREQGNLLERIASTSPEVLYVFDVDQWRITFMNQAVENVLGHPPGRFTERGSDRFVADLLHPTDRAGLSQYRARVTALTDAGTVDATFRMRHASGEWRWLRLRTRVLSRHPTGSIRELLGTVTDFTEHRRAQEALRTSEERYRTVSEMTSDYAFAVRMNPDRTVEREWITEAFASITGYEPEEMSEQQWTELVHPDDHEIRRQQFADAIRAGQVIHEYRIIRKTGETRVIREHARVIGNADGSLHWYGACRDITDQTIAEAQRALSEERFTAITQSSHDIILEFDTVGRTVYVSPNIEELLGYSPAEVFAVGHRELVHPDDRATLRARVDEMARTRSSDVLLFRVRNASDAWRWISASATAFEASSGEVRMVAVCRDITERLEMEEERRRLVSLVENSSEFIAMISPDGRILFANEGGQKLVGLTSDTDARSHTIFECLTPEDSQNLRFHALPAAIRDGHWDGDVRLRHFATGKRIATLAHVFVVTRASDDRDGTLAIVARDVSERITAERLLRESEARHRMLVESAYDLIAEFDLSGRFVYVSPNYQRQLGYAPGSLLGTSWFDHVHAQEREAARSALRGLSGSETRECAPLRLRHADGHWVWVETNLKRYENLAGATLILASSRDISRRKEAEEALARSREELLRSQKMEAVGRLAGGVAHDFNNLLTAIIGYCDLLLESLAHDEALRSDVDEIIRAANRAAELTHQLLAFSRRQVLVPRVLDLNALVADVDRLLRRLIGEDIELVARLDAQRPHVRLDPAQLEQLVINLAVNARDAMPRGGRLSISTANLALPPGGDPGHPGIAAGRYITLAVQDTGIGMSPATLSKIFEPFFTTKSATRGTGLGLATVYGIIQQSGGEIRVESEPRKGSTFTIYLPQVDADVDPVEAPVEHLAGSGGETILLVEDSNTVRNLIKRYLEKHGYTVLDAPGASDALQAAKIHPGRIDLLVTDVVLPKMDGHALAKRVAEIRPGLKVLYISGFSEDALAHHGVDARDIDLLQKPFAPAVLLREVERILGAAPEPSR